jgi:DNA-binding XRE family transcriptional regulator
MPRKSASPPEIVAHLNEIADALTCLSRGEDSEAALYRAVDNAVRTASDLAEPEQSEWSVAYSFAQLIARNVAKLRREAGWTQEQLASAMSRLDFSWQRVTVAEIETRDRRMTLEEVVGLSVLFALPVIQLLQPDETSVIDWPTGALTAHAVMQLFVGSGGVMGHGGVAWKAASKVAGVPSGRNDFRPAADLWRSRSAEAREQSVGRPGREGSDGAH